MLDSRHNSQLVAAMIDSKKVNEMVKSIISSLPPGVKTLGDDIESNVKACVMTAFDKMDLVTREEFDAQSKVLQRTREKLERLTEQVAKLEGQAKTDD